MDLLFLHCVLSSCLSLFLSFVISSSVSYTCICVLHFTMESTHWGQVGFIVLFCAHWLSEVPATATPAADDTVATDDTVIMTELRRSASSQASGPLRSAPSPLANWLIGHAMMTMEILVAILASWHAVWLTDIIAADRSQRSTLGWNTPKRNWWSTHPPLSSGPGPRICYICENMHVEIFLEYDLKSLLLTSC